MARAVCGFLLTASKGRVTIMCSLEHEHLWFKLNFQSISLMASSINFPLWSANLKIWKVEHILWNHCLPAMQFCLHHGPVVSMGTRVTAWQCIVQATDYGLIVIACSRWVFKPFGLASPSCLNTPPLIISWRRTIQIGHSLTITYMTTLQVVMWVATTNTQWH